MNRDAVSVIAADDVTSAGACNRGRSANHGPGGPNPEAVPGISEVSISSSIGTDVVALNHVPGRATNFDENTMLVIPANDVTLWGRHTADHVVVGASLDVNPEGKVTPVETAGGVGTNVIPNDDIARRVAAFNLDAGDIARNDIPSASRGSPNRVVRGVADEHPCIVPLGRWNGDVEISAKKIPSDSVPARGDSDGRIVKMIDYQAKYRAGTTAEGQAVCRGACVCSIELNLADCIVANRKRVRTGPRLGVSIDDDRVGYGRQGSCRADRVHPRARDVELDRVVTRPSVSVENCLTQRTCTGVGR